MYKNKKLIDENMRYERTMNIKQHQREGRSKTKNRRAESVP